MFVGEMGRLPGLSTVLRLRLDGGIAGDDVQAPIARELPLCHAIARSKPGYEGPSGTLDPCDQ